jgi:hypothetical protein
LTASIANALALGRRGCCGVDLTQGARCSMGLRGDIWNT